MNEVNVTIAGSVCDVQSTNNTHIICVTNAQRQSQETKVRVSIGDRGIAKMVREDKSGPLTSLTTQSCLCLSLNNIIRPVSISEYMFVLIHYLSLSLG